MSKEYFVTAEEAGAIDAYTINEIGIPQLVLMEKAAEGVAAEIRKQALKKTKILVLAEAGNNGADGIAAARILRHEGYENVEAICLGKVKKVSEAFIEQVEIAKRIGLETKILGNSIEMDELCEKIRQADLVVDAIFGVGLTREISGVHEAVIREINKKDCSKAVISVDIPSGIDSTTGVGLGTYVKAGTTVTFGYRKTGMLYGDGREASGDVICHDICLCPEKLPGHFSYNEETVLEKLPKRASESNKGSFGKVLVSAGAKNMCGAALFSARAAYKTGAGLVTVLTVEENREIIQRELPEAVLKTWKNEALSSEEIVDTGTICDSVKWADVIVLGPGIGTTEGAKCMMKLLLQEGSRLKKRVILDADALNLTAQDQEISKLVIRYAGEKIMTPHIGEAKRLLQNLEGQEARSISEIKNSRDMVAKKLAEVYDSIVVLKDARTVVVSQKEQAIYINLFGNSGMAKGGSGDALTGVIAALIGQGMLPEEAARVGSSLHAMAGDAAVEKTGLFSLMVSDLIEALPEVLRSAEKIGK